MQRGRRRNLMENLKLHSFTMPFTAIIRYVDGVICLLKCFFGRSRHGFWGSILFSIINFYSPNHVHQIRNFRLLTFCVSGIRRSVKASYKSKIRAYCFGYYLPDPHGFNLKTASNIQVSLLISTVPKENCICISLDGGWQLQPLNFFSFSKRWDRKAKSLHQKCNNIVICIMNYIWCVCVPTYSMAELFFVHK